MLRPERNCSSQSLCIGMRERFNRILVVVSEEREGEEDFSKICEQGQLGSAKPIGLGAILEKRGHGPAGD